MNTRTDDFAITTPGRGTRVYGPSGQLVTELAVDLPAGSFPDLVHIVLQHEERDWGHGARCHVGTDFVPWASSQ